MMGGSGCAVWLIVTGVVLVAATSLGQVILFVAFLIWLVAELVGGVDLGLSNSVELPAARPRAARPEPARRPKIRISSRVAASVRVKRVGEARKCPLCREPLSSALPRRSCARCETPHHEPCWDELGGCAVLGCRGSRRREVAA